ncbi:MAG: zinc ribbon domain-containing protein [Lactobacillales bacterium]|nr:zinc ribbon domain-containing protein [Lactobacillales bacterium]
MYCPNCGTDCSGGIKFCSNCGTNIMELNNESEIINENNNGNKNDKKNKLIIFSVIALIAIIIVVVLIVMNNNDSKDSNKEKDNKKDNVISDNIDNNKKEDKEEVNNENEEYNSYEKIVMDYKDKKIDVNKYFTQLVYLAYDSDKLDSKYKSNSKYYITESQLNLVEIMEENYDKLDKDILKFYLKNKSLSNVYLGKKDSDSVKQTNSDTDYVVKRLSDEETLPSEHVLDKVILSPNNKFLIWYTTTGDDAITDEDAKEIGKGLESTVAYYEQYFGIKYSYDPYVDNKLFNSDYKKAKKALKEYGISESNLKSAMSIYVYNTGSEGTAASYNDEQDGAKIINRSLYLDILDKDGVINYPYIIINKRAFVNSKESLIQLYNHELFHHMQYLYCMENSKARCKAGDELYDAIANYASAKSSKTTGKNNFLNEWAGIYRENTSTKLIDIVNHAGDTGYALFTYFDAYSNKVSNWKDVVMKAHLEKDAFAYIQKNTSKEDLINVINELAYNTLSQKYSNNNFLAIFDIKYKQDLNEKKVYDLSVNAGSIDYFELNNKTVLNVKNVNSEYVTLKVYGSKNNQYKELVSSKDKIDLDTAYYSNYDKLYLVVTNGDLTNSYKYTIDIKDTKYEENTTFNTSFNNYNIEIKMDMEMSGTSVNMVSTGVVDELHQKEYLKVSTTTMGLMTISNQIYYDFNKGVTYMTQPYGGDVWWKDSTTSQMVDLKKILEKLQNMKDVTKIDDNHYKIKMSGDDVKGLVASANTNVSNIKGNINVDVYTKDGYIVKLEYDFKDIVSGVDKFKTTIAFSNYNKAGDVNIPQTIIDNAKIMS